VEATKPSNANENNMDLCIKALFFDDVDRD
jgi:hypothetical protein